MQTYFNWLRDNQGNVVAGGQVAVYDANTSNLSAIYVPTNDGNATVPKSNPLTSDPNGYFEFSVPNGDYQLVLSGGNLATTIVRNVNIWDGGTSAGGPMTNPMSNLGEIIYGGAAGTPTAGAANTTTTPKYLREVGTGTAGAPPSWQQIQASEVAFTQTGTGASAQSVDTKLKQTFSVKDFGAVGDGATDDTAAIQAAMDAAGDWANGSAKATQLILNTGTYKITSTIHMRPYVSVVGMGMGRSIIKPTMSAGYALSSDATSGIEEAYLVHHSGFRIDGTNCTGTAGAWHFKTNKDSTFTQISIWNFSSVSAGNPPVYIDGACYGLRFVQCHWYNNKSHIKSLGVNAVSNFSTTCYFEDCIFEGGTDTTAVESSSAIWLRDVVNFQFIRCIIQANANYETIRISNLNSSFGEHIIEHCYFEDNGGGAANSSAVSLAGLAGKLITKCSINYNTWHQSVANKPNYQIRLTYTDGTRIFGNTEGFGGTFLKNSTNNTNVFYDNVTSGTGEFGNSLAPAAWVNFVGNSTATPGNNCTINSSYNVTNVVFNAAGNYTVNFTKPLATTGYAGVVSCEDGGATGRMFVGAVAAAGGANSCTVYTMDPTTGVLTSGRTTSLIVFGK